jgi:hypothetical protein
MSLESAKAWGSSKDLSKRAAKLHKLRALSSAVNEPNAPHPVPAPDSTAAPYTAAHPAHASDAAAMLQIAALLAAAPARGRRRPPAVRFAAAAGDGPPHSTLGIVLGDGREGLRRPQRRARVPGPRQRQRRPRRSRRPGPTGPPPAP